MKTSFFKIISVSLIIFTITVFFLALNIDKRYSTEKIVGKTLDSFEIKFLTNNEVFINNSEVQKVDSKWVNEVKPIIWTDDFNNLFEIVKW